MATGGTETILAVDDESSLLHSTAELLRLKDYKVLQAVNGPQALITLENQPVDLVLSNDIMPIMDGYELAAKIREQYPDVEIQLISGFNDERHVKVVDENLRKNLIVKPYKSSELLKRIRILLDS